jgi:hypothetical protein
VNKKLSLGEILPSVFIVRGKKAMIDSDLAALYQVETKILNQAVKRNIERFPTDFMFRLSEQEYGILKSQSVTSSWGGRRTLPYAFTEQGIAMLSSVLKSQRAIEVNISIMRAFVEMRKMITETDDLREMIIRLENKYDDQFKAVFSAIQQIIKDEPINHNPIGFIWPKIEAK